MKSKLILLFLILIKLNSFSQIKSSSIEPISQPFVALEIASKDKGLLISRLSSIDRNTITTPPNGLLIYNTSIDNFEVYKKSCCCWVSILDNPPKSEDLSEPPICEDFSNHGPSNPHLYAQRSTNSFVGNLISKYAPEYKINGQTDWKKMNLVSTVVPYSDLNVYQYSEPYLGIPRNTWLRSKEGCPEYSDVRNQQVIKNLLEDWTSLPTLNQTLLPAQLDYNLMVNTELENMNIYQNIDVYGFYCDRVISNLKIRVNGGQQLNFRSEPFDWFRVRNIGPTMTTDGFSVSKDFVLDVSADNFIRGHRYNVYRNYQGGHYSSVITMTRNDGRVFVTCLGLNWETDQKLIINNICKEFNNIPIFGNVFDLGVLEDGTYECQISSSNNKIINPRIILKVKKPSLIN